MLSRIKYHSVAFLFIFFLFTTCKKDKITSVNGIVVDATRSLSGVSNATVFLQEDDGGLFCFSCLPQTIATYNADAMGYFSFSFEAKKGASYIVVASAPNYFSSIGTGDFTALNTNSKNNIEAELRPVAWVEFHLKNTSPFDAGDQINVGNSFVSAGGGGTFYGTTVDTIVLGNVHGNTNYKLVWFVTKNGIQTPYSAAVYFPRFDTTSYNINY